MNTTVDIVNLQGIDKVLSKINLSKNSTSLNAYLGKKALEALKKVTLERINLNDDTNTNKEAIQSYIEHNQMETIPDGFVLYNNMPRIAWRNPKTGQSYEFSVALAFEFGTGDVGDGSAIEADKFGYQYNMHNYNFGWNYTGIDGQEHHTYGYIGTEIYRFTRQVIEDNIQKWYIEYINGGV